MESQPNSSSPKMNDWKGRWEVVALARMRDPSVRLTSKLAMLAEWERLVMPQVASIRLLMNRIRVYVPCIDLIVLS